jgi:hypothetical protein
MVVVALALVAFTSTVPTESKASSAALTSAAAALNSRLAVVSPRKDRVKWHQGLTGIVHTVASSYTQTTRAQEQGQTNGSPSRCGRESVRTCFSPMR